MTSSLPPDDTAGSLTAVLTQLTATGRPWLAVTPDAAALAGLPDAMRYDVTVLDATATADAPVTVNPFEPGPGSGVQAHASRLTALIEAVFRPPGPVRAVIRLALRRAYAECGWDHVTGTALPGAAAAPGIPSLGALRRAAQDTLADLGSDARLGVAVRGFLDARLGTLWTGPAGRYLAGGHPADLAGLLTRKVIFTAGDLADDEDVAFLTGVLLIRLAEQPPPAHQGTARRALVLAMPPAHSHRLRALLDDARASGVEVIHATPAPPQAKPAASAAQVPLLSRRSPACGLQCRQRPCSGRELHAAGLHAAADGQVWFRLWGEALVLAFLTGRPLPKVPAPVRRSWPAIDVRTRECLLATVVDNAVSARAHALRHSYQPNRLIAAVASTAAGLLAVAAQAVRSGPAVRVPTPIRAGHVWVIPQLRWLHEADRLCAADRQDIAPPLDFELAGLADWPGIRVGDRQDALRRHRLSMAYPPNRRIATTALTGAAAFGTDLAIAGIGLSGQQRLRHAARILGAAGWLEVVLSWPERLIGRPEPDGDRIASGQR